MKVQVDTEVTGQTISDLFVTAIEGGSNYWVGNGHVWLLSPDAKTLKDDIWYANAELFDGEFSIEVTWNCDGDKGKKIIGPAEVVKGLQLMATKYPHHWQNFVSENWDAETADVFVQLVVFGDIVYG